MTRRTKTGPVTRPPSHRLGREILALAFPSFLTSISVPLVGVVDTALVGHLGVVAFIGAVSVGSILFDTLFWSLGFLRMGTTALVAQAYGAGDDRRAGAVLIQSGIVGVVAGVALVLLREPVADLGLGLAGGTPEVQRWARAYVTVRIFSAPAVLVTYALNGFFRGMKDAVTPLVVTLVVQAVNVVGDIGLIHGRFGLPKLGVVGAAWASLAAALCGLLVAVAVLLWRYQTPLRTALSGTGALHSLWSPRRLGRLATTHGNLFARTLFLIAAYFMMVASAARLGEVALAANAIVLHLWHLSSFSVDGVAFAAETLIGNALGAGEGELTRRLGRRLLAAGVGVALVFSLAYWVAMRPIAGVFTQDPAIISAVVGLTALTVLAQPINAVAFVFDGIFIGADDMPYLFKQMGASFLVVFLPALLWFTGPGAMGLTGLWTAMCLFMMARSVTLAWRYRQPSWIAARLARAGS